MVFRRLARWLVVPALSLGAALSLAAAAPSLPPEFTHASAGDWINSPPLTLAGLRGKVVLLEFWAFKCEYCLKSIPWVRALEHSRGPSGLIVVGVHRPELPEERFSYAVHQAVARLGIDTPVMIDSNSSYWNALNIQYWPTFCLIGRDGLLYTCIPGEMRAGDPRAAALERAVDSLLAARPS
jgi:thiol-disulfide isomerase/thioredoxin